MTATLAEEIALTPSVSSFEGVSRADRARCRPQRVLVVDDHELVQAGIRAMLDAEPWVATCLGASSAEAAWAVARRHQPQMVLVSTSLQGRSGFEVCRMFRERLPHVRIVMMSSEGRVAPSLAIANGAIGFVPKGLPAAGIVAALKRAAQGHLVFPRGTTDQDATQLSRRELDVLRFLVKGLSNPEVALQLNLSRHTVKQHTSTVYRKLGVRNRAEAASKAQELGLVA